MKTCIQNQQFHEIIMLAKLVKIYSLEVQPMRGRKCYVLSILRG